MFSRRSKRPTISMRAARGMLSDDISLDVSSNESRSVSDFSSPTFSSSSASLNSGSEYTASPPAPVVDSTPHQRQQRQQQEEVSVTPIRTASSTIPSQLSPQMELRLNLLPRIGQFRSRGWITSEEEHNLTNILSHTKYDDKFEADEAAVMVKRKLNQIQRREIERLETEAASNEMFEDSPENKGDNSNNNNNRESTDEQTPDCQPPSILGNCRKGLSVSFDGTQSNKNQSSPQEPISKSLFSAAMQKKITKSPLKFDSKKFGRDEANKENSVNEAFEQEQSSSTTLDDIYTPHEATQIRGIDQTSMEDLFVEMSFFARLGFLQPPSCLKCAYHQTVGQKQQGNTTGTGISKPCNRLVAWRKDANVLLHPDKLEGNLLVVSCANATKLHKGETVSNYVWDRKQRLFTGP